MSPLHQKEASNSSFVAKLAVINLIGQLGCDREMVRPVTFFFFTAPLQTLSTGSFPDGYARYVTEIRYTR